MLAGGYSRCPRDLGRLRPHHGGDSSKAGAASAVCPFISAASCQLDGSCRLGGGRRAPEGVSSGRRGSQTPGSRGGLRNGAGEGPRGKGHMAPFGLVSSNGDWRQGRWRGLGHLWLRREVSPEGKQLCGVEVEAWVREPHPPGAGMAEKMPQRGQCTRASASGRRE